MSSRTDYAVSDFLRAGQQRLAELQKELSEVRQEIARGLNRGLEAAKNADAALADLSAAIVPDFTAASFQRAAALAGYRKLVDEDPVGKREAERAGLQEWIAKIDVDPRFRDRVKLRDPRVGQLTRKIAELEEFRAPFAEVLARLGHPRMSRLIAVKYGSEDYAVPIWRLSYYADWKAGDEILEKMPAGSTWADVRVQWLEASSSVHDYDGSLATLRAEVKAGEELEARHRAATDSLATLEVRHLAMARDAVGRHVEQTTVATLASMLAADTHVELLAKKYDGLAHKVTYLTELADKQLAPVEQALLQEKAKLERDLTKFRRPKKRGQRFPRDKFDKRFYGRDVRFRKQMDRYRAGHERVWVYDDWTRPSLASDFLWWDLMTDGRVDGNFIPQVNEWHSSRPDYRYERRRDDDWDRASESVAGSTTPNDHAGIDPS